MGVVLGMCAVAAVMLGSVASADAAAKRTKVAGDLDAPGLSAFNAPPSPPLPSCAGGIPDTTGAIGPRHYVEGVNGCIAVYGRGDLQPVAETPGVGFWGEPDPTGGVGMVDPQVAWDPHARRWYMAMLNTDVSQLLPDVFPPLPGGNRLHFAWSKTADPTDLENGWCKFTLSTGEVSDDFPNLGFSRRHIMIGTTRVVIATKEGAFGRVRAIAKPRDGDTSCGEPQISIFGSLGAPLRQADGQTVLVPAPVNPVHPGKRGWVIATDCLGGEEDEDDEDVPEVLEEETTCEGRGKRENQITVWRLQGPRDSPRLVKRGGIDVPVYRLPDPVPQPGSEGMLNALETQLTQAVSSDDPTRGDRELVWTQHAVGGRNGKAEVRWYELDLRRLSVVRRGSIDKRRNSVWNGAISPTKRGNGAVIQYNVGGARLLPQIRASSRGPRDGKRAMGGEIVLGRSAAPSEEGCDPVCGWGDYAGATPDPRRRNLVWGSNQVTGPAPTGDLTEPHWLTRNFALRHRR